MFRNFSANQLPKQVANQYRTGDGWLDVDTLESIVEVDSFTDEGDDGKLRSTVEVIHPDDTYDTFQWVPNTDRNTNDRFPFVWQRVEQGACRRKAA